MGKQTFFRATINDEKEFIAYLRSIADIVLIDFFSDSETSLFQLDLQPGFVKYDKYYIWNKEFPCEFKVMKNIRDEYFISDGDTPVIEVSRKNGNSEGDCRIYWSKYFCAPNGLTYDVEKFNKWYETVAKWIRKSARGKIGTGRPTYYLPEAWDIYLQENKK